MICSICRARIAQMMCRRCSRRICHQCHAGHGLCRYCRQELPREP